MVNSWSKDDPDGVRLTDHGRLRSAQRNLAEVDICYVLQHGTLVDRTGVTFCILLRRDIPTGDRANNEIARLEGTVVLMNSSSFVTTCYRNRKALRTICKKHKGRTDRTSSSCDDWFVIGSSSWEGEKECA